MDTGQVSTEQLEYQMRQTRARIDRKLDALTARTETVRRQAPKALLALVGASTCVALWARHRRHALRRRQANMRVS